MTQRPWMRDEEREREGKNVTELLPHTKTEKMAEKRGEKEEREKSATCHSASRTEKEIYECNRGTVHANTQLCGTEK